MSYSYFDMARKLSPRYCNSALLNSQGRKLQSSLQISDSNYVEWVRTIVYIFMSCLGKEVRIHFRVSELPPLTAVSKRIKNALSNQVARKLTQDRLYGLAYVTYTLYTRNPYGDGDLPAKIKRDLLEFHRDLSFLVANDLSQMKSLEPWLKEFVEDDEE